MAGLLAILRDLHRGQRQLRDLRELLDRLPHQLKAQRNKAAKQEDLLKQAQDALKRVKVTQMEKESALKTKTQQIDKYESQVNLVGSKKEFDALQHEIAHTKEVCRTLEDEILQAMTEVEERTTALPEIEKTAKAAREEFARFEATAKEKQTTLAAHVAEAQEKLKEIEKSLPEDQRSKYDRVTLSMGADGLAPVNGRTCMACSTEITEQSKNDLLSDRLIYCKSCGRILYMAE